MNEKESLILMVEDEEQVLNTNCRMLRRRGYDILTAQTASEARQQLDKQLPDLLILDIMLPDGDGLDICRHFREKTMNPVLFLTGKSDIRDKVEGLRQGGDYYLTKPYNFDEFLAVIQMLLERQKRMEEKIKENFQTSRQITIGSLRLDLSDGHAYLNNSDTGLTRTEFSLLRLLAENQEKIFSAKELYEAVWGSCAGTDTSTVRRHIFNLPDRDKACIPIIAMTANAFVEDKRDAIAAGMNGHIAKPIQVDKLLSILAEMIRQQEN